MIDLYTYLNEGLLSGQSKIMTGGNALTMQIRRSEVREFLKTNYIGTFKVSAKPNVDDLFEVSASINDIKLIKNTTSLTNGKFIFTDIGGKKRLNFTVNSDKLTDLSGAPKYISGDFIIIAPALKTLKGCENTETHNFMLSRCDKLESLEYCPKVIHHRINISITGIKTLKGIPEANNTYNTIFLNKLPNIIDLEGLNNKKVTSLDIWECVSLKSLKGGPQKALISVYITDCTAFSSLEGFPKKCDGPVSLVNCNTSFKPEDIEKVCDAGSIYVI